jgi:hypothetical protein
MQRVIDLGLSILACVVALFLSWPYWRDFEYWAESHTAWAIYFAGGFVLAVYVFYIFIGSLHILFLHAAEEGATAPAAGDADAGATECGRGARS